MFWQDDTKLIGCKIAGIHAATLQVRDSRHCSKQLPAASRSCNLRQYHAIALRPCSLLCLGSQPIVSGSHQQVQRRTLSSVLAAQAFVLLMATGVQHYEGQKYSQSISRTLPKAVCKPCHACLPSLACIGKQTKHPA